MGPLSSCAGNFICIAMMLRGKTFKRLGHEGRALMNGSMVLFQGQGSFLWEYVTNERMLDLISASPFSLLFSLSHSFSLPSTTGEGSLGNKALTRHEPL